MRTVALWSVVLFASSAALGGICALRCAEAPPASSAHATSSHCGDAPKPDTPEPNEPCRHGHGEEALVSSCIAPKTILIPATVVARAVDSALPVLRVGFRPAANAAESPPPRSVSSVLRL